MSNDVSERGEWKGRSRGKVRSGEEGLGRWVSSGRGNAKRWGEDEIIPAAKSSFNIVGKHRPPLHPNHNQRRKRAALITPLKATISEARHPEVVCFNYSFVACSK